MTPWAADGVQIPTAGVGSGNPGCSAWSWGSGSGPGWDIHTQEPRCLFLSSTFHAITNHVMYIYIYLNVLFNIFKPLHRQHQSQILAQRSVENWPCTCNLKPALPGWRASRCATNEGFRGLFFFSILF